MEVLQEKCSHRQRPGCCNSPTSHQCIEPSEQSPGIPTPPGRSPQSHPGMSTDPKTKQQKNKNNHPTTRNTELKLKIMENEKHPLDDLKNDEITKKREK